MSSYTGKVVGMHFRERDGIPAKALVGNMLEGTELTLEREPDNEYDAYAIKVLYDGQHIGYIEREVAMYAALDMDDGAEVTCTVEDFVTARNNLHPVVVITTAF